MEIKQLEFMRQVTKSDAEKREGEYILKLNPPLNSKL